MADKQEILTLEQAMEGLPPDFQFFGERFRTTIQPALQGREADREKAVKKQRNFGIAGVLLALVAGGGSLAYFQDQTGLIIAAISAFAGFGLWAWGSMALNKLGTETKLMLIEPVSAEFGMAFQLNPPMPQDMNTFKSLGLVPGWDRAKFEDRLTGARNQAPFEFFEAHLEERRTTTDSKGRTRTTWVTVFRGQCLVVKFIKEFKGVTKVYRDMGMLNFFAKLGQLGKGEKVKLEDPVFEKAFEVFSTDQIEARFILTPDFMERLLGLERTFKGKQVRCAFAGGEMFLACEGKNLLEAGSMYRRMDDLGRVREMLQDFAAVFLLIDAMSQRLTPDALRGPPV
jgi:predicted ribosomally synthesized peptide with SipW-like signal peptide